MTIWLESVDLDQPPEGVWPFTVPAVASMGTLRFERPVTFLAGENGSGKSTVLEALAVACGCPSEGGASTLEMIGPKARPRDYRGEWALATHVVPQWRAKPVGNAFFLRAETFHNVLTAAEESLSLRTHIPYDEIQLLQVYDGRSPHAFSHGEAFLELFGGRLAAKALYFMDEPEAPLSFRGCLSLLATLHDLVKAAAQLVVATHSAVLLAFPDAVIYELGPWGIEQRAWADTELVDNLRTFLDSPERYFQHLLAEDP